MSETLDLSNVINVTILPTQTGLALPEINTAALFSNETPDSGWDMGQTNKIYTNATDVGDDFGTDSDAYDIAVAFFSQQPNVLTTSGYLVIILLTAAEKIEAAITRIGDTVYYFGVLADGFLGGTDLANLAEAVQALDKMLFYCSKTKADFAPGGALDLIRQAKEDHTRCLYYDGDDDIDSQRFAAAYASRGLSTDFSGVNTTSTMHLKQLTGIVPDTTVDQTALTACQLAGVDVYVSIASVPGLFTSGANRFFDEVYNEFWFKFALQVAGFNYLAQTNTKIPQTEAGLEGLKNQYRKVCAQAVLNGFSAPGAWNSSTVFGNPADLIRCVADIGYYVWALPVAQQSQSDREDRKAPLIQIALKAAGAIHSSNVIVNVNL